MENRTAALRLVAEAVQLDGNGYSQTAFTKYIHGLQALSMYLNEMLSSFGFEIMMGKISEVKHVLSMINECSNRLSAISDKAAQSPLLMSPLAQKKDTELISRKSVEKVNPFKLSEIEKLQNENMKMLRTYQWRFERAKDMYARSNLKLELERQLTENDILIKKKFNLAVKQLQKERANAMEREMKLFESKQLLNESEKEKRDLYISVLEYAKTETWPCTWKINSWEMSDTEAVEKVFDSIMRCSDHPLSQWTTMMRTNIKRDVDTTLRHYSHLEKLLPHEAQYEEGDFFQIQELSDELIFFKNSSSERTNISKRNLSSLQKALSSISSEIIYVVSSVVDVFLLGYKSLLPLNSEEILYDFVGSYVLKPIWPNLFLLYRIVNIVAECKVMEVMFIFQTSKSTDFEFTAQVNFNSAVCNQCISLLKSLPDITSLVQKLKTLVQVSQLLCSSSSKKEGSQQTRIGADEFLPLLSYVLIKSKLPHLSSVCCAIEELFDIKFMFGEEGYALSSFLTAFKYIEMKKLIDGEESANKNKSNG